MKKLMEDIKKSHFERVYLLCGEEDYLKKSYRKRLQDAVCGDDTMNFHHYEGKNPDIKEILSLADTMPFFAEKRLLLIEDSGFFKTAAGAEIADYLPSCPQTTCFLFVESEVDKRNKLYKAVKDCGYVCEMGEQKEAALMRWVLGILTKEGKKITRNTMDLFLGKTGTDMETISQELEKLICYTYGREVITDEDVEAVCVAQTNVRIFDLIDAMTSRNQKMALSQYYELIANKEPPMRILYLLGRQFNLMLQVKSLTEQGAGKEEVASRLGVQGFIAQKTIRQADNFPVKTLKSALTACVETEEAIKTGRLDENMGVEMLLVRYTKIR